MQPMLKKKPNIHDSKDVMGMNSAKKCLQMSITKQNTIKKDNQVSSAKRTIGKCSSSKNLRERDDYGSMNLDFPRFSPKKVIGFNLDALDKLEDKSPTH